MLDLKVYFKVYKGCRTKANGIDMTSPNLFSPLQLPNGTELPNRLCKAAMEENLAEPGQVPGDHLTTLYQRWADGGVGLILTGNVMIDPGAVTGPGGVVLERGSDLAPFRKWADARRTGGGQICMQVKHPGRQLYAALGEQAVAASPIGVDLGKYSKMMAVPRGKSLRIVSAIVVQSGTIERGTFRAGAAKLRLVKVRRSIRGRRTLQGHAVADALVAQREAEELLVLQVLRQLGHSLDRQRPSASGTRLGVWSWA